MLYFRAGGQWMDFLETNKTFWRDRYSELWCFFCPLCKCARRVPFRPRPGGFRQVSQIVLTALFCTLLMWPIFNWKGVIMVVPFWTIFESVYRWRTRVALACPYCGFDPYLFIQDVKLAGQEVDAHWRKKFAEKGVPYPEKISAATVKLGLHRGGPPNDLNQNRDLT